MSARPLLGELLVREKLVSQETINNALKVQIGGNRRLGHILVKMQAVTADQLAQTLARQMNIPVINVEQEFSREVKKVIPRYICQQYGIIPLYHETDNVLTVAMSNPSDEEAIADLERYTDKAIKPCLALDSDINAAIKKNIPLSSKDFFSPIASTLATRMVASMALVLVCILGYFSFENAQQARYGIIKQTESRVLYENHDLILGLDYISGKVSLVGHGAYSQGFYSVAFDSVDVLKVFIDNRNKDFSTEQRTWLKWATEQIENPGLEHSLAVVQ